MKSKLLLLLWMCSLRALAQAPGVDWEHASSLGSDFEATCLREVGIGEVVAAGFTDVNVDYDIYVRRFLADGTVLWSSQIVAGDDAQATGISLSAGSGYAVCGWSSSFGGPSDFLLHLLTAGGTVVGTFTYGTADDEVANDIQTTSDFGYVMCGYRDHAGFGRDYHIVKVNSSGVQEWEKTYGGPDEDIAHAILQTSDGGYIVVGEAYVSYMTGKDVWVLRLDSNGDLMWNTSFDTPETEIGYGVAQANDGGFVFCGYQETSFPLDQDMLLFKCSASGILLWSTLFDNGGFDIAYDVDACSDDGFVLCGRSDGGATSEEVVALKFDEIGQHYWTVTTGGAAGDGSYEIRQLNSGGYIYCGYSANPQSEVIQFYVVKLLPDVPLEGPLPVELSSFDIISGDSQVRLVWNTASESELSRFELTRDGVLIADIAASNSATGSSYSFTDVNLTNGLTYSYQLSAVGIDGNRDLLASESATPNANAIVSEFALHQNYPNPFNPETSIRFDLSEASDVTLSIFNISGQEVALLVNGHLASGSHTITFDAANLTSGVYLYRLTAGSFTAQKKMVLLK